MSEHDEKQHKRAMRRARIDAFLDKWILTPILRVIGWLVGSDGF